MRRVLVLVAVAAVLATGVAVAQSDDGRRDVGHYVVQAGDVSAMAIARRLCGPDAPRSLGAEIHAMNRDLFAVLNVGEVLHVPARCPEVTPSTSTPGSAAPSSSAAPSTSTSTLPPATSVASSTTTTVAATSTTASTTTTTTTMTPTTTTPPASEDFVEDFATPAGFYDRFEADVHFRANDYDRDASFHGDHNMACEGPTTARTVHVPADDAQDITSEVFWWCAPRGPDTGHIMTGMGAAGFGYAITTFKPRQVFSDVRRVCVDVNATELGGDQWWEMSVVPASTFEANGGRMDYITALAAGIDDTALHFPTEAFVYQINDHKIRAYQGMTERVFDWYEWATPDRAARFEHCMVDNHDGTVTMTRKVGETSSSAPGGIRTVTVPGSFPAGDAVVLFQQSTYDPPKHGSGPTMTTWHWDRVTIDVA